MDKFIKVLLSAAAAALTVGFVVWHPSLFPVNSTRNIMQDGTVIHTKNNSVLIEIPAPGTSYWHKEWDWQEQGPPSTELKKIEENLKSPEDIMEFFRLSGMPWKSDYDLKIFLSPNNLIQRGHGVCSAFARFWVYELARLKIHGEFIAVYAPTSAHAICVFMAKNGHYYLASNQYLYTDDLGTDRTKAIIKAVQTFYSEWYVTEVYGEDGQVHEVIKGNLSMPTAVKDQPNPNFNIKR